MIMVHKWQMRRALFRRLGLAGFVFFFVKGMLWLSLPLLIGHLSI